MVYCCVPHCTSKSEKVKGISFHEFPCDPELKQKWLKNISRDNFVPNFESRTSFVCGLHFLDADYRPDLKIKKLKQNAIPSVFKGYSPNKIPKPIPQRRVLIKHEVKKTKNERGMSLLEIIMNVLFLTATTKTTLKIQLIAAGLLKFRQTPKLENIIKPKEKKHDCD